MNIKNIQAPALIEEYKRYAGRVLVDSSASPPMPLASPLVPKDTPPRRRLGRPRKNPTSTPPTADVATEATPTPPRRRGRPPRPSVPGGGSV